MSPEKGVSVRVAEGADEVTVGTVIAGKYRIDARLGSGGMGTVWACTHIALGDRMAVKIVSTSTALSQEVRARFSREARASARLKSRFSVRVFDSGELPNGTPYIVMEYLDGETLRELMRRVTRLPLAETVGILTQVARGLQRAHEEGIVHRDIKPDNIFLAQTPDDGLVAKVFDFGVAKLVDAANGMETVAGTFIGTPQFMSPEQAMGRPDVDHRTDVYSLGVLAYRMLTGRPLYETSSITALLLQICKGTLPKLRDTLPDLPVDVEAWFQRTCARDRDHRFASAVECADALVMAAGLSTSRLALSDSVISVSGTQPAHTRQRSTPVVPTPALSPAVIDPRSVTGIGSGPSWRTLALVMAVFGAFAAVVIAIGMLRHGSESRAEGLESHAAASSSTPENQKAPAPAAAHVDPTGAPLETAPAAATPVVPRPATRSTYATVQTGRSATQPPASKRPEQVPATASQSAKSANSAITDVGY